MRRTQGAALHALVLASLLCGAGSAAAASFTFEALNPGGTNLAYPFAINAQDQVVGQIYVGSQKTGFVWSSGQLTTVTGTSDLFGINGDGIAVGGASNGSVAYTSYDISTGQLSYIPIPFSNTGLVEAYGINDAGEVTGVVGRGKGGSKDLSFYSVNGVASKLVPPHEKAAIGLGINKTGDIILRYAGEYYYNPFIYRKGKFMQFAVPGASETGPVFIADSGAVGGYAEINNVSVGFVLSSGTYTTYSPPGSLGEEVTGIGPSGQVVGYFVDSSGADHGFVEVSGSYYQVDAPGASSTSLLGISSSGSIFGLYTNAQGTYGYIATCPKKDVCTQ